MMNDLQHQKTLSSWDSAFFYEKILKFPIFQGNLADIFIIRGETMRKIVNYPHLTLSAFEVGACKSELHRY